MSRPPSLPQTLKGDSLGGAVAPTQTESDSVVRIGRFLVLRMLGSGAMGVVYAAYDEILDRRLAVKVIRSDIRGREQARQRTLREAQGLARLSHPNVVQIYEVGEIANQVFIAMEFLQGDTLTNWLKVRKRDWQEILATFVQAGRGLAAAHAADLVHRDFKPDNVIVTTDGRVCVVDFGLVRGHRGGNEDLEASGTSSSLSDINITEPGTLLGTLAYMSPEQHNRLPVDARSDLFGFCVALWEALYGSRPFAGRTGAEVLANLLRGPPVQPPASSVPARVHAALVRGLALVPDLRHPSLDVLLDQLSRDRPRSRSLLTLTAGVLVGASLGLGYWSAGAAACGVDDLSREWNPARREALTATLRGSPLPHTHETSDRVARAIDRYAEEWSAQALASCEANRLGQQSERLFDLRTLCLERRRGEFRALLDTLGPGDINQALQAISAMPPPQRCAAVGALHAEAEQTMPPADPELAAAVEARSTDLEHARQAERLRRTDDLERQLAQLERSPAIRHPPFAASVHWLRSRLYYLRGRYGDAEHEARLAWLAGLRGGTLEVAAEAAIARARVQSLRLADFTAAEESLAEAEALLANSDDDPERTASLAAARGLLADARGEHVTAEGWFRQALAANERLHGDQDPRSGAAANDLAGALRWQNRLAEALPLYHRAVAIAEASYGLHHPAVAAPLNNLGNVYYDLQRYAEALPYYEKALALRRAGLGPDHPEVGDSLNNLANTLAALDRPDAAFELHTQVLAIRERTLGSRHPEVAVSLANGALAASALGRTGEATASLERALQIQQDALGPDHSDLATTLNALGNVRYAAADYPAAAAAYARAVALCERVSAYDPSELALWLENLGNAQVALGRDADARVSYARSLALAERAQSSTRQRLLPLLALARLARGDDDLRSVRDAANRALTSEDATLIPRERAELRFLVARTTWADDRSRTEALAREALGILEASGQAPELAAELKDWLRRPSTARIGLR